MIIIPAFEVEMISLKEKKWGKKNFANDKIYRLEISSVTFIVILIEKATKNGSIRFAFLLFYSLK